jgi:hypothetical protein
MKGFEFCGHTISPFVNYNTEKMQQDFNTKFGSNQYELSAIWADLQTTTVPGARIDNATERTLSYFLLTHHWLSCYPTNGEMAMDYKHLGHKETLREKTKLFTLKMALLRPIKIAWPAEFDQGNFRNYLFSLDGVHFEIMEVTHEELSKDPSWYSEKFNGPGMMYLVAVDIKQSRIVYASDGDKASEHDKTVFLLPGGLRDRTRPGKKGVGDKAFRGKRGDGRVPISTPSSHHTPDVREFQARVKSRQETLFKRMKGSFRILSTKFRHRDLDLHEIVFDAVLVILQYQFDNGRPLFDAE